jgi:hypothetical protein
MKNGNWLFAILSLGLLGMLLFSCNDETDDEEVVDTGEDTGSDTGLDTGTAVTACGGSQEDCCAGNTCTGAGLDPVIGSGDDCTCQEPCEATPCTAGTLEGSCTNLFGLMPIYACYNTTDFPMPVVANECTAGAVCTTDSGDAAGTCSMLMNPTTSTLVNRCLKTCTPAASTCPAGLLCSPAADPTTFAMDFTNSHCAPAAGMK